MSLRRRILLSPGSNGQGLSPPPSRQVPSHVIIAVATTGAASLFLALIYYAVFRHRRRRPRPLTHASASSSSDGHSDHPIWHVKTVGLDDAAIASIGSYAHRSPAADCFCPVCLGELLDGDTVRLLPRCGHVFHVQCIDTWLRCHVSCPLCRAAAADPCSAPTDDSGVEESSGESNPTPTQLDEGGGQEGEGGIEARVRVSVEIPESSGALRSISMDLEKDEEGLESDKGQNESGRGFLFSRLGRARSSSVLPL